MTLQSNLRIGDNKLARFILTLMLSLFSLNVVFQGVRMIPGVPQPDAPDRAPEAR